MANDSLEDEILALVGEGSESPPPSPLDVNVNGERRGESSRIGKSKSRRSSLLAGSYHGKGKKKRAKDEDSDSDYEGRGAHSSVKRQRSQGSSRAVRKEDATHSPSASASKVSPSSPVSDEVDSSINEVDGYDEHFRGDSRDRAWLAKLSEVERERVIAERAERRQKLLEHREIQSRMSADAVDEGHRRSSRKTSSSSYKDKSDSLRELRRRREDKGARRAVRGGHSPRDSRGSGKSQSSDSDSGSESEVSCEGLRRRQERNHEETKPAVPIPLADFVNLYIRRSHLAKWVHAPYFERAVIGAFVRVSSGEGVYRVAYVKDVVPHSKAYPLEQTVTDKALLLTYGSEERAFSMHWLSDSEIEPMEYERYIRRATADKGVIATRQYYEEKVKDINYARDYVLSEAEVSEMIRKRQKFDEGTVNVKQEIARLAHLRGCAQLEGDMEEFERLGRELQKFEQLYKSDKPSLYV